MCIRDRYANATSGRGSQYVAGGYTGSKSYEGLASSMSSVTAYLQTNKVAIDEAYEHESGIRQEIHNTQLEDGSRELSASEISDVLGGFLYSKFEALYN